MTSKKKPLGASMRLAPAEYRALTIGEKIEHLLGHGLNDAYVIAHWPIADCTPLQLHTKMKQFEVLLRSGMQMAAEAYRRRSNEDALKEVGAQLKDVLEQAKKESG